MKWVGRARRKGRMHLSFFVGAVSELTRMCNRQGKETSYEPPTIGSGFIASSLKLSRISKFIVMHWRKFSPHWLEVAHTNTQHVAGSIKCMPSSRKKR